MSIYNSWRNMRNRCNNPNSPDYKNYGGRGIKICERWDKFENFLEDMGERPEGLKLDRIDNDGDYCKDNCRWVTSKVSSNNRRNNRLITANGKTQTLAEWSEEIEINYQTIRNRIYRGWSEEKAINTQTKKQQRR